MTNLLNNLILGMMLILSAGLASASIVNVASVNGFIYDLNSNGVPAADVNVLCLNNSQSFNTTSNATGYYAGVFDCPMNGTVKVTGTKNNATNSATGTVVQYDTTQIADVTINFGLAYVDVQIPEFPTAAAPVLLSMLSFGMLRLRKR
jgi:hypothetical protein